MLRREAIRHFYGLSYAFAQEFCIGPEEDEAERQALIEALSALGVTQKEIEEAWND